MTPIPACVALSYPSVFVRANPQESLYEFLGRGSSMTAGCDGMDMKNFDEDLEGNLQRLREELREDRFQPYPVRRVYILKANRKLRPLVSRLSKTG
jgi:retron-type reverse transcriptase